MNNIVCFTGSISRETIGSHDVRGDLGAGLQQRSERRLRGRGAGGSREAQQTTNEAAGLIIPITYADHPTSTYYHDPGLVMTGMCDCRSRSSGFNLSRFIRFLNQEILKL